MRRLKSNRMRRIAAIIIFLLSFDAAVAQRHEAYPQQNQSVSPGTVVRNNQTEVIEYVMRVIHSSGTPVRLFYRSTCNSASSNVVPFPFIDAAPPSQSSTGFDALRQIFRNDPNVNVTENSTGVVTISVGKVRPPLLTTTIPKLELDSIARYNPADVIIAAQNAVETRRAMRVLKLQPVSDPRGARALPLEGLPRLPPLLRNLTVDEILSKVATTWAGEGMIIYGICDKPAPKTGLRNLWIEYSGAITPR
jgi:hypothetical protein